MTDTGTENNADNPVNVEQNPVNGTENTETPPEKTFTQADVNKIGAREKLDGRNAALKELGIDPKDSATVEELKKYLQSKKPESQVLAEQQIEQSNKIKEAEHRAFIAEVKAEMMQGGVQADCLDDAMALVVAKLAGDIGELPAVIENIKTKYPIWFAPAEPKGQGTAGHKGTGTPMKPGGGSISKQNDDLGKRLAEQFKQQSSAKSVHWGSQN
jgi:hypothetical protein